MTITYEATDRNCIRCGREVEDYIGHLEASEITSCEECHEEVEDDPQLGADVVHCVPRKEV